MRNPSTPSCRWSSYRSVRNIRELQQFQAALPGYQLKVISIDPPHMLIYIGPTPSDKIIQLIKEGEHYDGCNSFKGFLSRSYFCDDCNLGYNTEEFSRRRRQRGQSNTHPAMSRRWWKQRYSFLLQSRLHSWHVWPSWIPCRGYGRCRPRCHCHIPRSERVRWHVSFYNTVTPNVKKSWIKSSWEPIYCLSDQTDWLSKTPCVSCRFLWPISPPPSESLNCVRFLPSQIQHTRKPTWRALPEKKMYAN